MDEEMHLEKMTAKFGQRIPAKTLEESNGVAFLISHYCHLDTKTEC
jgi:hypothetical protein